MLKDRFDPFDTGKETEKKKTWKEYWESRGDPNISLLDKHTAIDDLILKQTEILKRIEILLGGATFPDVPKPPPMQYWKERTVSYEDTDFTTADSPKVLDVNSDLRGRNAHDGYMVNDGGGNITIQFSDNDGIDYGGEHTVKRDEILDFFMLDIDRIKLTWVTDSAYRILVI